MSRSIFAAPTVLLAVAAFWPILSRPKGVDWFIWLCCAAPRREPPSAPVVLGVDRIVLPKTLLALPATGAGGFRLNMLLLELVAVEPSPPAAPPNKLLEEAALLPNKLPAGGCVEFCMVLPLFVVVFVLFCDALVMLVRSGLGFG